MAQLATGLVDSIQKALAASVCLAASNRNSEGTVQKGAGRKKPLIAPPRTDYKAATAAGQEMQILGKCVLIWLLVLINEYKYVVLLIWISHEAIFCVHFL